MNVFKKAADAIRALGKASQESPSALDRTNKMVQASPIPEVVKRKLPRSSFTKTGPGVTATLRYALEKMNPAQRLVAREFGWDRGMVNPDGSL